MEIVFMTVLCLGMIAAAGYCIYEESRNKEEIRKWLNTESKMDEFCGNFCKYTGTEDSHGLCEWIRKGNDCPLGRN